MKHLDLKELWVQDSVAKGEFTVVKEPIQSNWADLYDEAISWAASLGVGQDDAAPKGLASGNSGQLRLAGEGPKVMRRHLAMVPPRST